jgi:hypothetical protein
METYGSVLGVQHVRALHFLGFHSIFWLDGSLNGDLLYHNDKIHHST